MHIFSMTCKIDSVLESFGTEAGRRKAIEWMKAHGISKVYLETYRHGRLAENTELLKEMRDDFASNGFEVSGCITPTQMSKRIATWPITTCFTDYSAHEFLRKVVEMTASIFDEIILDDFFFTSCTCQFCTEAMKGQNIGDFRSRLMREIAEKYILEPARTVNKNAKVIVKYPCWYDGYYNAGYDVVRESEIFDKTWIGTETRDPESVAAGERPQTAASWIQGWMNDVSKGKCGGGWYDPIDTSPATFAEQARQTILGGAKESLLHCYDYLATDNPGLVVHGRDLKIENGFADAEAFRKEMKALRTLAERLEEMTPVGVIVPKKPNSDPASEYYLPSFIGMLGIPVVPSASLKKADAAFLSVQSAGFSDIQEYIASLLAESKPVVVTTGLLECLKDRLPYAAGIMSKISHSEDSPFIFDAGNGLTVLQTVPDNWKLMSLDRKELEKVRNALLRPFDIEFNAPAKVSLHLFRSEKTQITIIENFNDSAVDVQFRHMKIAAREWKTGLALPDESALLKKIDNGNCMNISLAPRSMFMTEAKT